jgi:putative addiction module CopG family antidote
MRFWPRVATPVRQIASLDSILIQPEMTVMQIQLPQELQPFVEQEFATGRYASREEVIVQALRWLREERQEAVSGIKQGLDDAAEGRIQPIGEAFSDIRKEFGVPETE